MMGDLEFLINPDRFNNERGRGRDRGGFANRGGGRGFNRGRGRGGVENRGGRGGFDHRGRGRGGFRGGHVEHNDNNPGGAINTGGRGGFDRGRGRGGFRGGHVEHNDNNPGGVINNAGRGGFENRGGRGGFDHRGRGRGGFRGGHIGRNDNNQGGAINNLIGLRGDGNNRVNGMHDQIDLQEEDHGARNVNALEHQRQRVERIRFTPKVNDLRSLVQMDEHDLLMAVSDRNSRFHAALYKCGDEKTDISLNHIPVLLELMAKIMKCTHSNDIVNNLILDMLNTPFFQQRLPKLVTFEILEIIQNRKWTVEDGRQCINNILAVLTSMLERVENQAFEKLSLVITGTTSLIQTFQSLKPNGESIISDDTRMLHQELMDLHTSTTVKRLSLMNKKEKRVNEIIEPPDNFRDYEIIPMKDELDKNNDAVFLRANRIQGKYRSVEDYLDVQFRLMREDFVSPLRTGINAHRDLRVNLGGAQKRITEIRIYPNVRIIHPCCLQTGIGFVVQLDLQRLGRRKIMWEKSKRLLFGSLLSFWDEDFSTVIFAVVEDRHVDNLTNFGQFVVKFVNHRVVSEDFQRSFAMVESAAYFEAYRHVLTRLKNITADNLPFVNHLVECDPIIQPPQYLARDLTRTFNFRCLLKNQGNAPSSLDIGPLNTKKWPTAEDLGLNPTQHTAIQNAITKKLALIQGPPGTGKTFIGLKIAQLLLENVIEPSKGAFGPMLLVCYTNHALDQFLEGISQFKGNKIVRVGGRSRSETLKKFALSNIRMEYIRGRAFPQDLRRNMGRCKSEIEGIQTQLSDCSARLKATFKHLISVSLLEEFMLPEHTLMFSREKDRKAKDDTLKSWLLGFSLDDFEFPPEVEVSLEEYTEEMLREIVAEEARSVVRQHLRLELEEEIYDDEVMFEDEVDFANNQRRLEEEDTVGERLKQIDKRVQNLVGTNEFLDVGANFYNATDDEGWQTVRPSARNMRRHIERELSHEDRMEKEEEERVISPMQLPWREKWRLYRLWRFRYQIRLKDRIQVLSDDYDRSCREHVELRAHSDRVVMAAQEVIAMTTTGAARYGDMLNIIRPRIIMVEEAAEVFESHVVASLSSGCQHLILIGDHKQLRPSPAVYQLAKKYSLDVSLFERLIKNDFHHDTLGLQHRMRPEISSLVRHSGIYPELGDHPSVRDRPVVMGVAHNVFFVDHQYLENNCDDIQSYSNDFEAQYALRLCQHFLMQGYKANQITVLTLYSGQLFLLKKYVKGKNLSGLLVTVVDNYQGEENDIIILSLVRSNKENKIGFVGIDNRICVALSRAKIGLYVIGNFSLMKQKSTLWSRVVELVEDEEQIGPGLNLVCQMHPETEPKCVRTVKEFDRLAPEGGCSKVCGKRLVCGHVCVKMCHPMDREHKQIQCRERCGRKCRRGFHECDRLCYKTCGDCMIQIEAKLPCNHTIMMPCHMNPLTFRCTGPCSFTLPCGHKCSNKCGEGHTVRCEKMVEKVSPFCGHKIMTECWRPVTLAECSEPCMKTMECGHRCEGSCGKCSEGRLHIPCYHPCERTLICGHPCRYPCTRNCPPCSEKCEFKCDHADCDEACGATCIPCRMPCPNRCRHRQCNRLCHEMCNRLPCDEPCNLPFRCKKCNRIVRCPGVCGETCIKMCRNCDKEELTEIFFGTEDEEDALFILLRTCNHIFEVSGLDTWMNGDEANGEIVAKVCPRCKTPITMASCHRYYNICRKNILTVQEVKQKVNSEENKFGRSMSQLKMNLELRTFHELTRLTEIDFKLFLSERIKKCVFMNELLACENAFNLAKILEKIATGFYALLDRHLVSEESRVDRFKHNVKCILRIFQHKYLPEAVLNQCAVEVRRVGDLCKILKILVEYNKCVKTGKEEYRSKIYSIWNCCVRWQTYDESYSTTKMKELQEAANFFRCGLNITDKERVDIIKAMGLSQGHWYKCPNGHVYAIGECGGPMERTKCPECDTDIGGMSHSLARGNAVATEMDGSRQPAYPVF